MSNEEDNARIQELEKQLAVIYTAIDIQSNDPDSWATLKDSPDFELIGQMALMDLYRLNIKLKDELSQLEKKFSAEQAEKIRRLESMVYNIPSIGPVTADATVTKKVGPEGPNKASEFAATVSLPFQGVGFFVPSYDVDFSAVGTRRPRSATWFLKNASTLPDNDTFTTDNGRLMTVKNGANKLFDILLFNNDLSKLAETPTSDASSASQRKGLVSKDFLPELGKAFFPNMFSSESRSLKDLGCPVGLATSGSTPDGYLFGPSTSPQGKKVIRGIVEAKNSTMEVHVAMRQGISEAINVAMQLLTGGVRWAEVVVPILATNGHTLQIGVVYLLYATFPVFTFATRELHLLNADDRQEAVRVLVCLQRFLREELPANTKYLPPTTTTTPAPTSSSTAVAAATATGTESSVSSIAVLDARHGGDGSIPPVPPSTRPSDMDAERLLPSLSQLRDALPNIPTEPPSTLDPASQSEWNPLQRRFLDKSLYYFKELRSMYFAYGPTQVERSLRMFFEVMKALYRVEACRDSVVFPICLRQYDKDVKESGLVFPRLEQPKYRIGLPRDAAKRTAYFKALWSAVKVIHEEARVLHLDLYPSNIMWCDEDSGRVQIKLIDWDAAVLMDWHELPPHTASTLSTSHRYRLAYAYDKEIVGLSSSLDTCFIHLLEENQCVEALWSEAKETLDGTFRELVMKKLDLPTSEGFYMHE
eukprot:gene15776-11296_t